jgi:hypothetical protein
VATAIESTTSSTASATAPSGRGWTTGEGRPGPEVTAAARSSTSPSVTSSPMRSAIVERFNPVAAVSSERVQGPARCSRPSTALRLRRRRSPAARGRRPAPPVVATIGCRPLRRFVGGPTIYRRHRPRGRVHPTTAVEPGQNSALRHLTSPGRPPATRRGPTRTAWPGPASSHVRGLLRSPTYCGMLRETPCGPVPGPRRRREKRPRGACATGRTSGRASDPRGRGLPRPAAPRRQ